ncbi:MAG: hypothetical protein IT424_02505 [Pirellulales bacterium]|nr:hypothetical protein [Pirellulales bacterium]
MPPIVAILNPRSDRGRAALLAGELRAALAARHEVLLQHTGGRGEGVALAAAAAERGCPLVIAVGGDGAVHEVANGLRSVAAERRPVLGIVPAGSGNDVAYALGIEKKLDRSLEIIERARTRPVDVALVQADGGRQCYAVNNIGTLLEGEINLASHRLSWPRGSGLYVRAMLQTLLRPVNVAELSLTIDGEHSDLSAILLSIANGPRSGGKFLLMPQADPCDGWLNYVTAAPVGRLRLLCSAARAMRGGSPHDAWIRRGVFRQMTARSSRPLAVHVDGEPWLEPQAGCRELEINVLPGALQIIC